MLLFIIVVVTFLLFSEVFERLVLAVLTNTHKHTNKEITATGGKAY